MSEHDRGAYAPPTADAPLSFDARQPVRGSRPFPVTLVISGLVLLGLIMAIFLFYRSGVREAGQPPKTVGTPVAEMKSAPPADAQPDDPAAGLQIYQSENGQAQAGKPNFVAPPEQPAERTSPAQAAPPPAPAPTTPVAASAELRPALPPPVAPQVTTPAAPRAAQPAPAPIKAAPARPAPVKAAAPKPEPVKPPAPARTSGGAAVQIGAVSSTALADAAWKDAVRIAPGLAAGKGKGVEKIDKNGHVLFRTAVTGFASKTEAAAFCAKLKAAGKACFVK